MRVQVGLEDFLETVDRIGLARLGSPALGGHCGCGLDGEAEPQGAVRLVGRGALDEEFRCVCHGPNVGAIPDSVNPAEGLARCCGDPCGSSRARVRRAGFEGWEWRVPGLLQRVRRLAGIGEAAGEPMRLSPPGGGRRCGGAAEARLVRLGRNFEIAVRAEGWNPHGSWGAFEMPESCPALVAEISRLSSWQTGKDAVVEVLGGLGQGDAGAGALEEARR